MLFSLQGFRYESGDMWHQVPYAIIDIHVCACWLCLYTLSLPIGCRQLRCKHHAGSSR